MAVLNSAFSKSWYLIRKKIIKYLMDYAHVIYLFIYFGHQIFDGNDDGASVTCCELPYPIVVRYLRFRPVSWHEKICLRVGVFGKGNVTGKCVLLKVRRES